MGKNQNILGKISTYFIKNYRTVYLLILMIGFVGYLAYNQLPREEKPEMVRSFVSVSVDYSGVSPENMESLVTNIIEAGVESVEGAISITSTTSNGNSKVSVDFEDGWDMEQASLDIQSAIAGLKLPEEASDPKVSSFNSVEMPIMNIAISGDYPLSELKGYAENLQKAINGVDGVSETTITGGLDTVINIYVDEDRMDMYGLTFSNISSTINAANTVNPIGTDQLDTLEYTLSIVSEIGAVEEMASIIVTDIDGYPVYLSDIAEIKMEYVEANSISKRYDATLQDEKEMISAVSLSVQREADSDVVGASAEIHKIIDSSIGTILPEDVNVIVSNEDAVNVEEALDNVESNALSGLLLVIVVLFIFIGFRESIIVATVIPLSLFISLICMNIFGVTLNTMSMVALILALGMLVDNAIVIMENIDRIRDDGHDIISSAKFATNQVAPAVMAATLTTIAAFIPLSFAGGILGQIMSGIPLVVIFAIVASFAISIVVTPTLCSRFLSKHKHNKRLPLVGRIFAVLLVGALSALAFEGSVVMWFAIPVFVLAMIIKQFLLRKDKREEGSHGLFIENYGKILGRLIGNPLATLICFAAVGIIFYFSITMVTSGKLAIELIPKRDSTALTIASAIPTGYLIEDAIDIADQMEEIILSYDEILSVVSKVSKSSVSYSIEIVPEDQREVSSAELIDTIREEMSSIIGANVAAVQDLRGYKSSSPIKIEILGENSDDVATVSDDFMKILKSIEGTTEVTSTLTGGPPEIRLIINEEKAYEYGLDAAKIATGIKEHIYGKEVTSLVLEGGETDVKLLYSGSDINSIADYSSITYNGNGGTKVRFDQVVIVEEIKGMTKISHEDLQRIESITSNIEDAYNVTELLAQFEQSIENYELPKGITINFAGESEDIQETFGALFISMGVAIFLVYLILVVQFNSMSQPIVVLFTIPLATIGSIWGLILTGNNFSTYAFFGVVSLVGIAVNDAIVLVDYFNYLRREEGKSIKEAIVEGGKTRFIPVFSTTITTVGGVLPLALKDQEYAQLGYALIFGLLVATVLTLVIIPMIYMLFEQSKIRIRKYIPLLVDER